MTTRLSIVITFTFFVGLWVGLHQWASAAILLAGMSRSVYLLFRYTAVREGA